MGGDGAGEQATGTIDRRKLIKGAAAVGGVVWAVPVVQTVGMHAAAAGSAPKQVLPNSFGVLYTHNSPWTCSSLSAVQCVDDLPDDPNGCGLAVQVSDPNNGALLVIELDPGYHLEEGRACCADGSTTDAVEVGLIGTVAIGPAYRFTCGDNDFFRAEGLIVADAVNT